MPDALRLPDLPDEIVYVWNWFAEIYDGGLLSFVEIAAWSSLTGVNLTPDEARQLRQLSKIANEVATNDA